MVDVPRLFANSPACWENLYLIRATANPFAVSALGTPRIAFDEFFLERGHVGERVLRPSQTRLVVLKTFVRYCLFLTNPSAVTQRWADVPRIANVKHLVQDKLGFHVEKCPSKDGACVAFPSPRLQHPSRQQRGTKREVGRKMEEGKASPISASEIERASLNTMIVD
jgi:hypothetical protein